MDEPTVSLVEPQCTKQPPERRVCVDDAQPSPLVRQSPSNVCRCVAIERTTIVTGDWRPRGAIKFSPFISIADFARAHGSSKMPQWLIPSQLGFHIGLNFGNDALSSLPSSASAWTNLQNLWLNDNALSSLPSSVSAWTNLEYLQLKWNALSSLPSSVSAWVNLRDLNLFHNTLSSLPSAVSAWTTIQVLSFDNNALSSLPSAVSTWTNLQYLWLNHNALSSLPSAVSAWTRLHHIDLGYNPLLTTASVSPLNGPPSLLEIGGRAVLLNSHHS